MSPTPETDDAKRKFGNKDLDNAATRLTSSMDARSIRLRRMLKDRRHSRGQDILIGLIVCLFITLGGMTLTFYRHVTAGESERHDLEIRLHRIEAHEVANHPSDNDVLKPFPRPSQSSTK
jgi:hypothetical protein